MAVMKFIIYFNACRLSLGNRPLIRALSLTFLLRRAQKKPFEGLFHSIGHPVKSLLCAGGAFKLHTVIEKGEEEKREAQRKRGRERKKAARFWRSGTTCEEERGAWKGMNNVEGDGKPEAQLRPSFSAALPIYILRRIYRRMCMFLISWMHTNRARARARCIDATMRLARRTFSDARIAILLFLRHPIRSPPFSPSRIHVHPSHFYTNSRSFVRFSLSPFSSPSFLSVSLFFFAHLQHPRIFSVRFHLSSLAHFVIL